MFFGSSEMITPPSDQNQNPQFYDQGVTTPSTSHHQHQPKEPKFIAAL